MNIQYIKDIGNAVFNPFWADRGFFVQAIDT